MKRLLLVLALVLALAIPVSAVSTYTFTSGAYTYFVVNGTVGSATFTVPTGVTSVDLYALIANGGTGGNGASGDGESYGKGGSGGANSSIVAHSTISVSSGSSYPIVLGGTNSSALGYTVTAGSNGAPGSGYGDPSPGPGSNGYTFDGVSPATGASGAGYGAGGYGGAGSLYYSPGAGNAGVPGLVVIRYSTPTIPVASFTQDLSSGDLPLTVSFTDTSTGTPSSWIWNKTSVFGDAIPTTFATTQNPSYTFSTAGNYSIVLYATNGYGTGASTQVSWVNVSSNDVSAQFTVNQTSGYPNDCFQFTDTSDGSPDSWHWLFGDGGTSTLQNPTHCYASIGSFSVTLTANRTDY